MNVRRLPNGHLLVPRRAESGDGTVGDGMVEVEPGTPEYGEWAPFALGGNMETSATCPRCNSQGVIPILYGLPGPEMTQDSIAGRVKLGGCMVWPEAPDWHCARCAHEWRGDEAKL